jgi:hypothetical protein
MDSILTDQLEWLISGNMEGLRFKRQILLLAGCLADGPIPPHIEQEINKLCKRIALEEVFTALLEPINAFLRNAKSKEAPPLDLSGLLAQVEATRQALNDCEAVNQPSLITWILGQAREKKLLSKLRSSR